MFGRVLNFKFFEFLYRLKSKIELSLLLNQLFTKPIQQVVHQLVNKFTTKRDHLPTLMLLVHGVHFFKNDPAKGVRLFVGGEVERRHAVVRLERVKVWPRTSVLEGEVELLLPDTGLRVVQIVDAYEVVPPAVVLHEARDAGQLLSPSCVVRLFA